MIDLLSEENQGFTQDQMFIEKEQSVKPTNASQPAFYAAAINGSYEQDPQRVVDLYRKIKTDIETTGTSTDYDSVMNFIKTDSDKYDRQAMTEVLKDPKKSTEEKQSLIGQYLKDREGDINLADEYLQRIYVGEEVTNPEDAAQKDYDASFVFDRFKYYDTIQEASARVVSETFDPSVKANILGFGELVLPFVEGYTLQQAKEEVFGEDTLWQSIKNTILVGENKTQIRDALMRMPYEQRTEASRRLLSAIASMPGYDHKKMYAIQDLIEDPEYSNWARGVEDLVGVLDLAVIGSAIKTVGRVGKGVANSEVVGNLFPRKAQLSVTAEGSKTLASKLAAGALKGEGEELAAAVGSTKNEIASTMVLPKWDEAVIRDLPSDVVDELNSIEKLGDDIMTQVSTHGINYSTIEKEAAIEATNEALGAADGIKLHLNKSIMSLSPDVDIAAGKHLEKYSGIAMYGSTVKNGFSSVTKALTQAGKNFPDPETVNIYKKNAKTGEFDLVVDIEQEIGKKGSYFVGYKFEHVYNPLDAAIYGADAVSKLGANKLGGYLFDVTARFDRLISQSSLFASNLAPAIEKRLLDVIGRDLVKLNRDSKLKLFYALEEGSRQGKMFSPTYLKNKLEMSDKEVKSYYAYRKVTDVMYSLTDADAARKLRANGMQRVRVKGSNESLFAKQIDDDYATQNVKTVYNPVTGTVETLDAAKLAGIFNGGGKIGRMSKPMRVGGHKTDYMLIDPKTTKFNAIKGPVLPYLEGYFHRAYKEFYFVDKVPKSMTVNGARISDRAVLMRDHADTVAGYSTLAEAQAAARELSGSTKIEHVARRGKEYENFYDKDFELYSRALSSTKRRGHHLEGYGEKGLANIEDPIESLYNSVSALSSKLSYDDLLETLRNRWMNEFGKFIPSVDGMRQFPRDANMLVKQAGTPQEYRNAVALLDHISNLSRIPAASDKAWQGFMMSLSETLENIIPKSMAVGVKELGKTSPAALLRKLPSVLFIAMHPLRQAIVQSMQLLQYSFVEPKYILTGGFSRDIIGLSLARSTFDKPALYAKARLGGAKIMGVSPKEYDDIVDAYLNKSGLPYSIDSNFYIDGLVKNIHESTLMSPIKRTAAATWNVGRKVVQYSKAAGFDVGEFMNLTGSWLIARRKFLDSNPHLAGKWLEKSHQEVISAHAREISYAMTTPGQLKYQKGLLSIPLQFMAVPHKAMLSMLPEMFGGSKAFSASDKVRIAAANLVWFGGAGYGINSLIETIQDRVGTDLPPELDAVIRGGLIDMSFNVLINTMADDKNDGTAIKFADSFAPLSGGLFFNDVLSKVLHEDWRKAVFGPSYSIVGFENSKISRVIEDIGAVTSAPDLSTPDKLKLSMLSVASLASGVSDYMKYRYALHTGKLVSSRGDDTVNVTRAEALATLFGFATEKEEDAYTYLKESYDEEKELKDYAKSHYEAIERAYKLYGQDDRDTYKMHLFAWQSMLNGLDPYEKEMVADNMEKLARQKMQSTGDSLINRMARDAGRGGDIRENMINELNRSTAITEDQKRNIFGILDDSMNGEFLNGK